MTAHHDSKPKYPFPGVHLAKKLTLMCPSIVQFKDRSGKIASINYNGTLWGVGLMMPKQKKIEKRKVRAKISKD
jgi:hypothetical protein